MDDHDITEFTNALTDASQFVGRGTSEATATGELLGLRRAGLVWDWTQLAVKALAIGMAVDCPPPVARAILQTPEAVWIDEAEGCCHTEWFIDLLRTRAGTAPDVWVALGVPDTRSFGISAAAWNPANRGHGVEVADMRWFVEVRGRGLGLPRGKLVRTGLEPLRPGDGPALDGTDDPVLMRMGRRILRGHPVRR